MIVGNWERSNYLNSLSDIGYTNLTLNTTKGGSRLPSAVAARMTVQLDDSMPGWRKTQLLFLSLACWKWKQSSSIAPTWNAGNCFSRWSWRRTDLKVAILLSRWGGSFDGNVPSLERNSLCLLQNLKYISIETPSRISIKANLSAHPDEALKHGSSFLIKDSPYVWRSWAFTDKFPSNLDRIHSIISSSYE